MLTINVAFIHNNVYSYSRVTEHDISTIVNTINYVASYVVQPFGHDFNLVVWIAKLHVCIFFIQLACT